MIMQPEEVRFIYDESFKQPWDRFSKLISVLGKGTKYLNLVKNPFFIQYRQHHLESKNELRYFDCEHVISVDELHDAKENYDSFYQEVENIFTKVKDVNGYKKSIIKNTKFFVDRIEKYLPKESAKQYLKAKG